ncbi:MAG: hypothetical protein PUB75_01130 [Firmicutes bacterium]|nr:hypothetical protein [Bacillota bacterium]
MFELHQSIHSEYGLCLWTILAIIVFFIMVVFFVVHVIRQSKRKYDYERELEEQAENISAEMKAQEVE